jgi:hypothetical protein
MSCAAWPVSGSIANDRPVLSSEIAPYTKKKKSFWEIRQLKSLHVPWMSARHRDRTFSTNSRRMKFKSALRVIEPNIVVDETLLSIWVLSQKYFVLHHKTTILRSRIVVLILKHQHAQSLIGHLYAFFSFMHAIFLAPLTLHIYIIIILLLLWEQSFLFCIFSCLLCIYWYFFAACVGC